MQNLYAAAVEEPHIWSGANPWVVGGIVLTILLALLVALLMFGAGREHS
ncbi:hypothetical protein HZF07_22720 [Nocardioides sp. CGMCC 1.13656]|nr:MULTISPECIES: hypothetical protein [unclassified Nocardioides]MBA2956548.1 hypothetical protein [Nocardioides sp. CGMCC 1.13656]